MNSSAGKVAGIGRLVRAFPDVHRAGRHVEFNRNQYFMFGLVLLFMGIQFRMVETYVLNEKASRFIAERLDRGAADSSGATRSIMPAAGPTPRRTIQPPDWLGWALGSAGAVLILHSLAMKKPGA